MDKIRDLQYQYNSKEQVLKNGNIMFAQDIVKDLFWLNRKVKSRDEEIKKLEKMMNHLLLHDEELYKHIVKTFRDEKQMKEGKETLSKLAKKIPNHLVIDKILWVGDIKVEINHIDNDLSNPLDYANAFKKMVEKLKLNSDSDIKCEIFPEDEWIK